MLRLEGMSVSLPTSQNILSKHSMASKFDRLLRLEEKTATESIELTAEQVALIAKATPCFAEGQVESSLPGELLAQDLFSTGQL